MLANQLITDHYPTVEPDDRIFTALQLMEDFDILHIAVVTGNKYLGLISKDDLLDADDGAAIKILSNNLLQKSIKSNEHFLSALKLASQYALSIVPVVNNEQEWVGAIPYVELLKASAKFTGAEEPGAVIVLEMERKSYSFGEISRLVETNDAYITQFNTLFETETGLLVATIKINKLEVSDILATFQRYEYNIRYFIGEEHYENELRYNYDNLMSYLKV
ncbi:CBS domain-containing protein [Segetibacter koreensis]|uniref:CBS domain-containing protein n=1 Tax=Segetibacter koreensis TaxID=398037 RepID=UPI00037789C3|nr:CBS domain-containing protein [Segetibacter koreensis]